MDAEQIIDVVAEPEAAAIEIADEATDAEVAADDSTEVVADVAEAADDDASEVVAETVDEADAEADEDSDDEDSDDEEPAEAEL